MMRLEVIHPQTADLNEDGVEDIFGAGVGFASPLGIAIDMHPLWQMESSNEIFQVQLFMILMEIVLMMWLLLGEMRS